MKSIRDGKFVYHLTHLDNLEFILERGLCGRADLADVPFEDVADREIIVKRENHQLDGFVPFHFLQNSPFVGGVVKAHADPRFILIGMRRTFAKRRGWSIVPRHPLTDREEPKVLSWDEGFGAIDWEVMDTKDYSDPHCKMVCMAEALSPEPILAEHFGAIFTPNGEVHDIVKAMYSGDLWPPEPSENMFPPKAR